MLGQDKVGRWVRRVLEDKLGLGLGSGFGLGERNRVGARVRFRVRVSKVLSYDQGQG